MLTFMHQNKNSVFSIDERGPITKSFKIELTFTLLDWLRMDKVIENKCEESKCNFK